MVYILLSRFYYTYFEIAVYSFRLSFSNDSYGYSTTGPRNPDQLVMEVSAQQARISDEVAPIPGYDRQRRRDHGRPGSNPEQVFGLHGGRRQSPGYGHEENKPIFQALQEISDEVYGMLPAATMPSILTAD